MKRIFHTLALAGAVLAGHAAAQPLFEGFLCCNLRSDGSWISEINYVWPGARLFPVGTPVKVTGYGRQRVFLDIEGGKQALGNDYSRDLALDAFAERYILKEDPRPKIATFPEKIPLKNLSISLVIPNLFRNLPTKSKIRFNNYLYLIYSITLEDAETSSA
jgi:hypothetical protein